ncbi:MAG: hypothetical protein P9M03_04920 [Candidatus Theseobacter exili]|nr:hypothetical protein [Candidatus Theseobacter exili]
MMDRSVTSAESIERALQAGEDAGLRYVYSGNISIGKGENTCCPKCGLSLIERSGYFATIKGLNGMFCSSCGENIAGVWE